MEQMLRELVDLLTCHRLEPEELQDQVDGILAAVRDPAGDEDLSFLVETGDDDEQTVLEVALFFKLMDEFCCSDKVDELHAPIAELFDPPLADFPYGEIRTVIEYSGWLDQQLAARAGKRYAALEYECMVTGDELCVTLPLADDVPRIVELAQGLGLDISPLGTKLAALSR